MKVNLTNLKKAKLGKASQVVGESLVTLFALGTFAYSLYKVVLYLKDNLPLFN